MAERCPVKSSVVMLSIGNEDSHHRAQNFTPGIFRLGCMSLMPPRPYTMKELGDQRTSREPAPENGGCNQPTRFIPVSETGVACRTLRHLKGTKEQAARKGTTVGTLVGIAERTNDNKQFFRIRRRICIRIAPCIGKWRFGNFKPAKYRPMRLCNTYWAKLYMGLESR